MSTFAMPEPGLSHDHGFAPKARRVQGTSVPDGGLGVSPRSKNPPLRHGEGDTGGEVKDFWDKAHDHQAGAIIVAAGQSRRMDSVDKLFLPILGMPLIAHTLAAFEAAPSVQTIVLVLSRANVEQGKALVRKHGFAKVHQVCLGGERRQDSVRQGLERLTPYPWVVIHDGARPCVEPELIERGLEEAYRWGSAVAAVPVKDTVKIVGAQGMVIETPDRQKLWAAQTPQVFSWDVLQRAHGQTGIDIEATDDAALVERLGNPVHIFFGSYANIKVTTREDVVLAEALLRRREGLAV